MIIDARSLPAGSVLQTAVCIIGAGAAGITLAREFSNARFPVVLLESGGMDYEPETQELYQGHSIGSPFQDLTASRLRFFGGTTNHWGGWCLPYEAIDFEARDDLPYHGWPFGRAQLDPWYRRAQEVCRIGPLDYRPASWGIAANAIPPPFAGPHFECKILQVSETRFGPVYAAELVREPQLSAYLHANAVQISAGGTDTEIYEISVKTLSGNQFAVRARICILAAGGIENARLLLASGKEGGNGLGNEHDLVGRFLMVHLHYSGGTIVPSDPHVNLDFQVGGDYGGFGGKHAFVPFIALSAASMRRLGLPSLNLWCGFRFSPIAPAIKALKRLIGGEGPGGSRLADLSEVIGNLDGVASFAVRKGLFGEGIPIEAVELNCTSEQQPNRHSRLFLGSERDRLGMPKIVVDWRLTPEDKTNTAATLRQRGRTRPAALPDTDGSRRRYRSAGASIVWPLAAPRVVLQTGR